MEPFHRTLTIACPTCNVRLVRVSQTAYMDFAICPGCLAAGSYDTVVDDPGELTTAYILPEVVQEFMRRRAGTA
jgi:phage FluMu protein Com